MVAALVVGTIGTFAYVNPPGLVALHTLDHPLVTWAAVWLLALAAAVLWRPPRWQVALAALPVLVAGYVTGFSATYVEVVYNTTLVARAVSPDGRYEARVISFDETSDVADEVRVRTRRGLLSTERVIWTPPPEHYANLAAVRFTGRRTIEIADDDGAVYTVSF